MNSKKIEQQKDRLTTSLSLFTTPKKNTICATKQPSKATNQHHSPNGDCGRFLRGAAQISESQTATKSKSSEGEIFYHLKQRRKIFSPKFRLSVNFLTDSLLLYILKIEWELFYYRSPIIINAEEIKRISDEYQKCLESGENNLDDFEVKPKKWRKIDVNQQLHVNWEHFANYVWSEYQKISAESDNFTKIEVES